MTVARSTEIVHILERLRYQADVTLVLKDGSEISGIYEGLRSDQVLIADGNETTFPTEMPLARVANVLLEFSSGPPE